jgi:hypothetical protein
MEDDLENSEHWWIESDHNELWAGLRIAVFIRVDEGMELFMILGEADLRRVGVRVWSDVSEREGWKKLEQIPRPAKYRKASPAGVCTYSPSEAHKLASA